MSYSDNEIVPSGGRERKPLGGRPLLALPFGYEEHKYTWEQVLRILRKNLAFGLLVAGSLMALVVLYALSQKDFYRPTARLEIAPPGSGIKTLHEIESSSEADNLDYLETQVQVLGSDALAVSVIRDLHLDQNSEFVGRSQEKEALEAAASDMHYQPPAPELAILKEQLDLATLSPAESGALERFRNNLAVASVRNTRLIELSYSSHNPRLAQLITNTLVTKFIDQNFKHHYTTTMQASEWLSAQLNDLRRKVDESGQAVADYQKKYGLVEIDDRDVPLSQLMSEVNHQLSEAQASRIEDEAYVRMVDEGHSDAVPALRDDKFYQDLMTRYSDLRTQLAQVKAVYGDANSNVNKLQNQVAEVSLQIDAERKRLISRTRSLYAAAESRESLMMQQREKVRAQMGQMSSQLTTFHMLKNEANANAELYNTLQGRLQEAGIYAGLRSSNIRVIDLATNLHKATGPRRAVLVTLGGFGSILCAVVLSFVREGFQNTIRTPDDVRAWTGLPSLAMLPEMHGGTVPSLDPGVSSLFSNFGRSAREKQAAIPISIMKSPTMEAEAMRDLRAVLLHSKARHAPSMVLVTSGMEGEGKTTVAVNFAIALAQVGTTCLLEADLRQPTIAKVFKITPLNGVSEVLLGSATLDNALVSITGIDKLSLLVCGKLPASPADLLSSPQMTALLHTLKQTFDFVVIDSPPVLRFSDARLLSSVADTVVLVGRCGLTTRRAMQRTTELLDEVQGSLAGVVLNGVDFSSPDFNFYTYGYRGRGAGVHRGGSPGSDDQQRPRAMGAHA